MTSSEPRMFHYHGYCFSTIKSQPKSSNRNFNSNERYATWICNQSSLAHRLKVLFYFVHGTPTRLIQVQLGWSGGHYRELIINLLTMLWSNIFKISKKLTYKKPLNFEICQIFARFAINVLLKWVYVKQ